MPDQGTFDVPKDAKAFMSKLKLTQHDPAICVAFLQRPVRRALEAIHADELVGFPPPAYLNTTNVTYVS